MKLFQQMLVATASLGLIAPIAAQASDVINLEGIRTISQNHILIAKCTDLLLT